MKYPLTSLVAYVALLCSCTSSPDQVSRPNVRLGGAFSNALEATLSADGVPSVDFDTDTTAVELGVGATNVAPNDDGEQRKISRFELVLGRASYELSDADIDVDAYEIGAGGRMYFGAGPTLQPFISANATGTFFEDVDDETVGTLVSLRAGGGVELGLGENFFLDLVLDYSIPLIAAESEDDPFLGTVETELTGLTLRVGIGMLF